MVVIECSGRLYWFTWWYVIINVIFLDFWGGRGDGGSCGSREGSEIHVVWAYYHLLWYIHRLCTMPYGLDHCGWRVSLWLVVVVCCFSAENWGIDATTWWFGRLVLYQQHVYDFVNESITLLIQSGSHLLFWLGWVEQCPWPNSWYKSWQMWTVVITNTRRDMIHTINYYRTTTLYTRSMKVTILLFILIRLCIWT